MCVLRRQIARSFPAKSFGCCMYKSTILTKSSAVAFTSEMPSSIAQETKAGQCVLVCGLPASSPLPGAFIQVGGLGFAFGKSGRRLALSLRSPQRKQCSLEQTHQRSNATVERGSFLCLFVSIASLQAYKTRFVNIGVNSLYSRITSDKLVQ